jgi:acetyl esterase/lipase
MSFTKDKIMRYRLNLIILTLVFVSYSYGLNYNVPKTSVAPTIDGVLSANEWTSAMAISMVYPAIVTASKEGAVNSATYPPDSAQDLSATWYFMWDNTALYVACKVQDSSLYWLCSEGPYSQDGVQLCFNFRNDPAAVYRAEAAVYDFAPRTSSSTAPDIYKRDNTYFSLPNGVIGSSFPSGGYIVEVKMPWSDFDSGYVPAVNDIHGAGLVLLDYDSESVTEPGSTIMADFGKRSYSASTVSTWNTLKLVDSLACGDFGYLPQDLNRDCVVNMVDFAAFAESWLVSEAEIEINNPTIDFNSVTPDYSQVQFISDISYLGSGRNEKMDFYLPADSSSSQYPAVLIIHGGGWSGGDKHGTREQIAGTNLARQGYVCASINYALCNAGDTSNPSWPQNIYDCKKAIQFLRKNAATYKIDPNHIGVIDGSAGGHLAALLGVAGVDVGLEPIDGQYVGTSTNVQAVVDMYGITDLATWNTSAGQRYLGCSLQNCPDTWHKASPIFNVTSDDPPFLILHGTADTTVSLDQSLRFVDELELKNVHVELMEITGAPHSFAIQMKGLDLRPAIVSFFDKYLRPAKK